MTGKRQKYRSSWPYLIPRVSLKLRNCIFSIVFATIFNVFGPPHLLYSVLSFSLGVDWLLQRTLDSYENKLYRTKVYLLNYAWLKLSFLTPLVGKRMIFRIAHASVTSFLL